jgi:hypothetical protein
MSNLITFLGIRSGVGNATLARAFATEGAESNHCLLIELDQSIDTTYSWAQRREKKGWNPSVPVERMALNAFLERSCAEELVVVQAIYSSDIAACHIAQKSRLLVLTATPEFEDIQILLRIIQNLSTQGFKQKMLVALCCPRPVEEDLLNGALELLARQNLEAIAVPFFGNHVTTLLKESGLSVCESRRPGYAQESTAIIRRIQAIYVEQ